MFTHAESRSLWPALAFVPWLLLGIACLFYAARQKVRESLRSHGGQGAQVPVRARRFHAITLLGLALLAGSRLAVADPAAASSPGCVAATPQETSVLADRLFEKGEYQRAGECYQAAGDLVHANLAFLKAAGPTGQDTARDLKVQRDAAKALLAGVAHAFKGNH